jgi:3-hydroxy-3-methylglutaryl CoA synthase
MIHGGKAREGGPEKAVAGFDEDAITMAVSAAADALVDFDRSQIDALYFASTSSPFREKQGAAFIARALDLSANISTLDFANTLRAAAGALLAAVNAVKAGEKKNVLVIASDCRLAAPRSPMEMNVGDAAAAFLISTDISPNRVIATIDHSFAVADEIYDIWRSEHDEYLKSWEDRFNVMHGYTDNLLSAAKGFYEKTGGSAKDYSKAVIYGPDARSLYAVAKKIGFSPEQVQEPLFGKVGNCGAAFTSLLLVAALEQAKAGEKLLTGFYGDGAEILGISVTEGNQNFAAHHRVDWYLNRGKALRSYDSYLKSRHLDAGEFDRRAGDGVPATVHYRERDTDVSFLAQQCTTCGDVHFPATRVCYKCYSKDTFEKVRLSDMKGRVMSYSFDYFFPSPEPPLIVGMCEVENGARVYMQMTDATKEMLRCDLPVEFVFRKIHDVGNKPNYFWKSRPLVDAGNKNNNNKTDKEEVA